MITLHTTLKIFCCAGVGSFSVRYRCGRANHKKMQKQTFKIEKKFAVKLDNSPALQNSGILGFLLNDISISLQPNPN